MEEDYFYPSDLQDTRIEPKNYKFNRPWGVPVRYHDFEEYNSKISLIYSNFTSPIQI